MRSERLLWGKSICPWETRAQHSTHAMPTIAMRATGAARSEQRARRIASTYLSVAIVSRWAFLNRSAVQTSRTGLAEQSQNQATQVFRGDMSGRIIVGLGSRGQGSLRRANQLSSLALRLAEIELARPPP